MKKGILTIAVSIGLLAANFVNTKWTVDKENAKIEWELTEQNESGEFTDMDADIVFSEDNLASAKIVATVQVASQNSGNKMRDKHIQSKDYFMAETYPTMTFESSSISASQIEGYIAKGNLKVKDTTNEIEIPFTFTPTNKGGIFSGTLKINTSKIGLTKKVKGTDEEKPNSIIKITVPVIKG